MCVQFNSVQSLSYVQLSATPWIAAHQASLSITNSQSSLRLTSIKLVMPSSHLILCRPLLLLLSIPPSIRVFSNESTLRMRWPKYWSFSLKHHSFQRNPRADLLPNPAHRFTKYITLASYLMSLCFSFFITKVRIMIASVLEDSIKAKWVSESRSFRTH